MNNWFSTAFTVRFCMKGMTPTQQHCLTLAEAERFCSWLEQVYGKQITGRAMPCQIIDNKANKTVWHYAIA